MREIHETGESYACSKDGLMFDTERVFVEAWDYAGENGIWNRALALVWGLLDS